MAQNDGCAALSAESGDQAPRQDHGRASRAERPVTAAAAVPLSRLQQDLHHRLLVGCYRFKRFTDSRRNGGNGHSPLELAGAQPPVADWLDYLLTPPRQQHST